MSTRIEDIKEVVARGERLPEYYECGCCSCYHPATWDGDCRDDANRYALGELDEKHGAFGWLEVDAEFADAVERMPFNVGAED